MGRKRADGEELSKRTKPPPWTAVGRTIVMVRSMTKAEARLEGWDIDHIDGPTIVLVLDDGSKLYASRDPEGNGPGAMFAFAGGFTLSLIDPARR